MGASTSEKPGKSEKSGKSEKEKPSGEVADLALDTDLGRAIRMVSSAFRRVATESVADLPGGARAHLVLVALAGGEPPSRLPSRRRSASTAP